MRPGKLVFAVLLGMAALVGGAFLAGWLIIALLHVQVPLAWNTWWSYVHAIGLPQVAPYVTKIKLASSIGFGVPLLAWLGVLYRMFRTPERSLYGEARFARGGDLARQDALKNDPSGILAGRFGGRFIRVGKSKHLLLASPTRSGKGVGVVIPNCLAWASSLVMLDVKQEAYEKSAGWRATLGPAYLFDPFSDTRRSHRWNPLTYVSLDPCQRNSDITAIAASLYKETATSDPFWAEMSKSTFIAVCEYLFDRYAALDAKAPYPTLGEVYRTLSGVGAGDKESRQAFFQRLAQASFTGEKARTGLLNLVNLAEQTFSSAVATTLAPLAIFGNPVVDAATSEDDFDLRTLRRQVQSIYVGVAPSKLVEAKGVLNLFFEQAIKLNGSVLPEHDKTLKVQCLFLLDEFTALGRVDIIPVAVGWAAGYGMRFVIVIQSIAQLEAVYGAETARGLVTNLGAQIIYAPREQRDADEYSRMLGETTVKRRQYSRNLGQGGGRSYTEVLDRRPLMNPDEVKALDSRKAIVMIEGVGFPILANKIFYYKDGYFKKRLLPPPAVPVLALCNPAIINAEIVERPGPLPAGGSPVQPKPTPNLPHPMPPAAPMPAHEQEDDPMKLHQAAAAAMIPLVVAAGCSHPDPSHPKMNPYPVKRYEVIATSDAPGPWDSVKGYLEYQVANPECTPEDKFLGVHAMPQMVGHDFEMNRVDDKTWKGYFYRDFLQDEDYYGLDICHWEPSSVSAVFVVHGEVFGPGSVFNDFMKNNSQTEYFKISDFMNRSQTVDPLSFLAKDADVVQQPAAFFPITVTIKEVTP